jgi:hypothetical protein
VKKGIKMDNDFIYKTPLVSKNFGSKELYENPKNTFQEDAEVGKSFLFLFEIHLMLTI